MSFEDYLAETTASLFEQYGAAATYTPKGGAAASIYVVFTQGPNLQDKIQVRSLAGVIDVLKADVAQPKVEDVITLSGATWRVIEIMGGNSAMWFLAVEKYV